MDVVKLDQLYKLYRFQILPVSNGRYRAYAHTSRYFSNVDIITLDRSLSFGEIEHIEKNISNLGFSTNLRKYASIDEAEERLFNGFFDVGNSISDLQKSYEEYKRKVSEVILGNYEYINGSYLDIEAGELKDDSIIDAITNDFSVPGPLLIVLEAAAGFGKTSTSYEVLNVLINQPGYNKIPLFTELSRNRQASIFKYVLYDEMNRKFTGVSLELVYKRIIEGRIPVIMYRPLITWTVF